MDKPSLSNEYYNNNKLDEDIVFKVGTKVKILMVEHGKCKKFGVVTKFFTPKQRKELVSLAFELKQTGFVSKELLECAKTVKVPEYRRAL